MTGTTKDKQIAIKAKKALKDEKYLLRLLGDLEEKCDQRWPSFNVLMRLSEKHPQKLYQKWDKLINIFKRGHSLTKLAVIHLVANLTKADRENKFEDFFNDYFGELDTKRTVTAAYVALNAGKIANYKPNLEPKITRKLLGLQKSKHKNKKILQACAMEAFCQYFDKTRAQKKIIAFAKQQLKEGNPKGKKAAKIILEKSAGKTRGVYPV